MAPTMRFGIITIEDRFGEGERWYCLPELNGGPLDPQSSALTN